MSDFDTKRDGVRCEIIETGEVFNSLQACADRLGVSARWLKVEWLIGTPKNLFPQCLN